MGGGGACKRGAYKRGALKRGAYKWEGLVRGGSYK